MKSAVRAAAALGAAAALASQPAVSEDAKRPATYPAKPVRMVIPLAPGGGSDIVGRMLAHALTEQWGQNVVVDNRPGAGSIVGTALAARAAPDGYTMLVSSSSIAISPALYKNLDFDVARDFTGVTLIASQPSLLVVHPSVAAAGVKDLVALARKSPGRLPYASAGIGSATHLGTELLMYAAKIELLHVPYKSAGLATNALVSGEAQVLLTNMASVLPHVAAGRLKAMGISSIDRSTLAPQVPTLAESGLPGFEYATWYGMLMPAGTPARIVRYVQASAAGVLKSPQTAQRFTGRGLQTYGTSPGEFERYLGSEIEKWGKVVKAAGIRVE